jgi:hypothetical protein
VCWAVPRLTAVVYVDLIVVKVSNGKVAKLTSTEAINEERPFWVHWSEHIHGRWGIDPTSEVQAVARFRRWSGHPADAAAIP